MDAALGEYLDRSGLAPRINEAGIVPKWPELVGPGIARVTKPLRVARGILIVAVRSSSWVMELKMMESRILEQINRDRDTAKLRGIRFVLGIE